MIRVRMQTIPYMLLCHTSVPVIKATVLIISRGNQYKKLVYNNIRLGFLSTFRSQEDSVTSGNYMYWLATPLVIMLAKHPLSIPSCNGGMGVWVWEWRSGNGNLGMQQIGAMCECWKWGPLIFDRNCKFHNQWQPHHLHSYCRQHTWQEVQQPDPNPVAAQNCHSQSHFFPFWPMRLQLASRELSACMKLPLCQNAYHSKESHCFEKCVLMCARSTIDTAQPSPYLLFYYSWLCSTFEQSVPRTITMVTSRFNSIFHRISCHHHSGEDPGNMAYKFQYQNGDFCPCQSSGAGQFGIICMCAFKIILKGTADWTIWARPFLFMGEE